MTDYILAFLAGSYHASRDSPENPWRDRMLEACRLRVCEAHTSCVRREAIIAYNIWYQENHT